MESEAWKEAEPPLPFVVTIEIMNRFSPGRRVLVGQRKRIGTVKSVADSPDPKTMGADMQESSTS
jgi:hypothetical protein